jgi:hypothetical protein
MGIAKMINKNGTKARIPPGQIHQYIKIVNQTGFYLNQQFADKLRRGSNQKVNSETQIDKQEKKAKSTPPQMRQQHLQAGSHFAFKGSLKQANTHNNRLSISVNFQENEI